jgi:hypothetical protein
MWVTINNSRIPSNFFPGKKSAFILDSMEQILVMFEFRGVDPQTEECETEMKRIARFVCIFNEFRDALWYNLPPCGTFPQVSVLFTKVLPAPVVFIMDSLSPIEQLFLLAREIPRPTPTIMDNWQITAQILLWQQYLAMTNIHRPSTEFTPSLRNLFVNECRIYRSDESFVVRGFRPSTYWRRSDYR